MVRQAGRTSSSSIILILQYRFFPYRRHCGPVATIRFARYASTGVSRRMTESTGVSPGQQRS